MSLKNDILYIVKHRSNEVPVTNKVYFELMELVEELRPKLERQQYEDLRHVIAYHHIMALEMQDIKRMIENKKERSLTNRIKKLFKK